VIAPVVVTDGPNHFVITLKKQDFGLNEKDKPREVDYFSTEQAPIPIALLLDTSKYSSDKVDAERVARHQKLLLRTRLAPLPAERNLADREKGI